ncbi:MAG: MbnP family protein [Bacteroidota bacterium]
MKNPLFRWAITLICLPLITVSCGKEHDKPVAPQFIFKHNLNGYELQRGVMNYTNQAGNVYEVDQLQYFISDITIKTSDGQLIPASPDTTIHYVDLDIPATLTWSPVNRLPVTVYDSISFVVGITEAKNATGLFVNPPERDMFWPDIMGGGYHNLKMNGKWKAENDTIKAFNLHLGKGMNSDGTTFSPNYFTVTLPLHVQAGTLSNVFTITMNIEKWFEAPIVWDWNVTGGQIMQNQDAMHKACENGAHAFQVSHVGTDIVYHN